MLERRIILIGGAASELCLAAGMARELGAEVRLAPPGEALAILREDGADLLMIEVGEDVAAFVSQLRAEQLPVPVLACGVNASAEQAMEAIRAGCDDYVPLPLDRELIAQVLQSLGGQPAGPVDALIGQTVDDVERALILRTLERCNGNRTSASTILGISVRTMRNKLRSFTDAGYRVSPAT